MQKFFYASFILIFLYAALPKDIFAQHPIISKGEIKNLPKKFIRYGLASYYAKKFNGHKTATGVIFKSDKLTAACNILPLGTWVKVTNLRNKRSVTVEINDRLHFRNKRLIDLTRFGAQKLRFISRGITRVKIEVIARPDLK